MELSQAARITTVSRRRSAAISRTVSLRPQRRSAATTTLRRPSGDSDGRTASSTSAFSRERRFSPVRAHSIRTAELLKRQTPPPHRLLQVRGESPSPGRSCSARRPAQMVAPLPTPPRAPAETQLRCVCPGLRSTGTRSRQNSVNGGHRALRTVSFRCAPHGAWSPRTTRCLGGRTPRDPERSKKEFPRPQLAQGGGGAGFCCSSPRRGRRKCSPRKSASRASPASGVSEARSWSAASAPTVEPTPSRT